MEPTIVLMVHNRLLESENARAESRTKTENGVICVRRVIDIKMKMNRTIFDPIVFFRIMPSDNMEIYIIEV